MKKSSAFENEQEYNDYKEWRHRYYDQLRQIIKDFTKEQLIEDSILQCWKANRFLNKANHFQTLVEKQLEIIAALKKYIEVNRANTLEIRDTIEDIQRKEAAIQTVVEECMSLAGRKAILGKYTNRFTLANKTIKNLNDGRSQGPKKLKLTAAENKVKLKQLIDSIGDAWKMSNKVLTDKIFKLKIVPYKESTLLKKVGKIIAPIRKAEKEKLGQNNP